MSTLIVTHSSGFFSCTSVRLISIIDYFNRNKCLPLLIDSTKQYMFYREEGYNIEELFFKDFMKMENTEGDILYTKNIEFRDYQFEDYNLINFKECRPFIDKYFSPSISVSKCIDFIRIKYNIYDNNTCSVMYRGLDKITETNLPDYDVFINKAHKILKMFPDIRFLVQTDEIEFLEKFTLSIPNSFHIEEIPKINKNNHGNIMFCKNKIIPTLFYNAALHVMSKSRFIICTSGNGEFWISLFRGNADGIYQYCNPLGSINDSNRNYFFN